MALGSRWLWAVDWFLLPGSCTIPSWAGGSCCPALDLQRLMQQVCRLWHEEFPSQLTGTTDPSREGLEVGRGAVKEQEQVRLAGCSRCQGQVWELIASTVTPVPR